MALPASPAGAGGQQPRPLLLPPGPCLLPASRLGLRIHRCRGRSWRLPPAQLFWEQELGCLGGRGVAKGLEAGGPEERASSSATLTRPQCPEPPLGTKTQSRGHWGCGLKGLPLSWPQVSGNQMLGGLAFLSLFSFKAIRAGQGQLHFQLRKRVGRSTQAHKPNRLLQVCFSDTLETAQFRENSSHMLGPAFPERVQ